MALRIDGIADLKQELLSVVSADEEGLVFRVLGPDGGIFRLKAQGPLELERLGGQPTARPSLREQDL